jgi:N-acetylmuramoyl-L-alanine amidase
MNVTAHAALLARVLVAAALAASEASGADSPAMPFLTEEAPVAALARAFGFDVAADMHSTCIRLASAHNTIVIAPGMARALVNGGPLRLARAPHHVDGALVVGADLADLIRRLGTTEPLGESPARPGRPARPRAAFLPIEADPSRLVLSGGSASVALPPESPDGGGGPLVVIDPGHGGHDEGARGARATREKDVVLDVSLRLARHLRSKGMRTHLTRLDDSYVDLRERSAMANRVAADAFVSIHANSCAEASVSGVETWVADAQTSPSAPVRQLSLRLARAIQSAVAKTTETRDRGVRDGRYAVLANTNVPAVLVELGFLSHAPTERALACPRRRERIARALADAIASSLAPTAPRAGSQPKR